MNAPTEFSFIDSIYRRQTVARSDCLLGIGDDCALLTVPTGEALATSIDTMVEGRHFLKNSVPACVGTKVLASSLSDLAAMGASPRWICLAMTTPSLEDGWADGVMATFLKACVELDVQLVGGDLTRGPRSLTAQVFGSVPPALALKRSGAKVGDAIFVSGTLGDAGAALALSNETSVTDDQRYLLNRLWQPTPRLTLGQQLRGIASAAIDVSDGLVADLGHVLAASGVGATLDSRRLPLSAALIACQGQAAAREFALTAGDDYELCFTVPAAELASLDRVRESSEVAITQVGQIEATPGLRLLDEKGQERIASGSGFQHF